MEFKFTVENHEKVVKLFDNYPTKKAAVMPVLYIAQEQNGYISGEVIKEIATILEVSEEDVMGVVTFYTMYHQHMPGKYHLQVCTNVSCMLRGAYDIWEAVKAKTGLKNGETSADGLFSLEEVECMGSCGTAPMIAINEDFHENLTKEKALELIDSLN